MTLSSETLDRMAEERIAAEIAAFDYSLTSLVRITTLDEAKAESDYMQHALHYRWKNGQLPKDSRYFSLRAGSDDVRVLTVSVPADNICKHVVGRFNRRPTAKELGILGQFLESYNIRLEYDANSTH